MEYYQGNIKPSRHARSSRPLFHRGFSTLNGLWNFKIMHPEIVDMVYKLSSQRDIQNTGTRPRSNYSKISNSSK